MYVLVYDIHVYIWVHGLDIICTARMSCESHMTGKTRKPCDHMTMHAHDTSTSHANQGPMKSVYIYLYTCIYMYYRLSIVPIEVHFLILSLSRRP